MNSEEELNAKENAYHMYKQVERLTKALEEIYFLHHNDAYDIFLRDDASYEIVREALGLKDEQ